MKVVQSFIAQTIRPHSHWKVSLESYVWKSTFNRHFHKIVHFSVLLRVINFRIWTVHTRKFLAKVDCWHRLLKETFWCERALWWGWRYLFVPGSAWWATAATRVVSASVPRTGVWRCMIWSRVNARYIARAYCLWTAGWSYAVLISQWDTNRESV